jgi:Holliday junction DNA helicase RuvA
VIARLTGILVHKSPPSVTIDVQGVGYAVSTPLSTYTQLPDLKQTVTLQIHTHLRQSASGGGIELYGFLTAGERELFDLLIGVSGIGPRSALNILSGMNPADFAEAVRAGDEARLSGLPGIGKKTASRLILELKEKLPPSLLGTAAVGSRHGTETDRLIEEAVSALVNLGYKPNVAREVLKTALRRPAPSAEPHSVETLIKSALRELSR